MKRHTKFEIKYKDQKPYVACRECSAYDDTNFLVDWDVKAPNFRQKVEESLEKHNEKLNEVWTKTFLQVRNNGVIKYLPENNLWKFVFDFEGKELRELIGASELSSEKIKEVWNYMTKKVVALENNKKNGN